MKLVFRDAVVGDLFAINDVAMIVLATSRWTTYDGEKFIDVLVLKSGSQICQFITTQLDHDYNLLQRNAQCL